MTDDIYAEADKIGREADVLFRSDPHAAMALYRKAWDHVPEPKSKWDGVSWIWGMIASQQIRDGQYADAIISLRHIEESEYYPDQSSAMFDLGRSYYELGDMKQARHYFEQAWNASEGRAFRGEDLKYVKFLKNMNG